MSFEEPLVLSSKYLKKKKCDKIQEYIKYSDNLFAFQGSITPHGHYDVRVFYDSEKEIPKKDLKRHYGKLLEIMLEN